MTREAIGIGDNEELAKRDALKQLGLKSSENVKFEVIKKAEKKVFGLFGGSSAKVKAVVETPDEIEKIIEEFSIDDTAEMVKEVTFGSKIADEVLDFSDVENVENSVEYKIPDEKAGTVLESTETEKTENNSIVKDYDCAKEAKAYVERVLKAMGLDKVEVDMTEAEESAEITLSGEQVGMVIGRRGDTLDALQYLTGLVANHMGNTYFRITVNIGNYREKRERTLEALGRKLAFKVLKTGRNVSLEPMNPYERRIIHTAVQKVNGAISWSEGEVINRHVVIGPDPEYKRNYRKNSYNKNSKRPSNSYNRKKSYNNPRKSYNKFDTTPKTERTPKNEGGNFSLYGRVDNKNK